MLRYVGEAFWARMRVPLLGGVPVNPLLAIAFGILGFVNPGMWFLGGGLIGGIVLILSSSPRFRKLIQAREMTGRAQETKELEASLIAQLPLDARSRLGNLEGNIARVIATYIRTEAEDFVIDSAREALTKLRWAFLKLLVAQTTMAANDTGAAASIQREIEEVERDLRSTKITPNARASREATKEILLKRLSNVERRQHSLQEIESDLDRIEAQIALTLDDASLKGQPVAISGNIELASQLLDSGIFGASERLIADLDRRIGVGQAGVGSAVPAASEPLADSAPPPPVPTAGSPSVPPRGAAAARSTPTADPNTPPPLPQTEGQTS